ncbi:MAG: dihydrolipoyl dehydrogenase family protein, partial [Acidobacteriota bacterium]
HAGHLQVDFAAVMANKDEKVQRFKRAKVQAIQAGGYPVIQARGRFTGRHTVEAAGRTYRFTQGAVIASGSRPRLPPLPGLKDVPYMTSDDLMRLSRLPDSVLALGTGAVGLELSQFLARMGTRVTLFSRRRLFHATDPLLASEMEKVLAAEPNLELIQPVQPEELRRRDGQVEMRLQDGRTFTAESLVLATGREAVLDDLGLEEAGVQVQDHRVVCDAAMRTSHPRIFVAGDATGQEMILHVASQEGRVAGLNAADPASMLQVDRRISMRVIFTDPPLALLGLTEETALKQGMDVVASHTLFSTTGRAITQDVRHGVLKLVAAAGDGEILGAQILGPRADDLVHTLAAVLHYRGTAADLLAMPWYHPTLSEVFLGLARDLEESRRSRL